MTTRTVVHDAPVSADTRATVSFVLLLAALFIVFATPHFVGVQLWMLPLQIGTEPSAAITGGDIHPGDYGQISHTRYADGATCTYLSAGPLTVELCR